MGTARASPRHLPAFLPCGGTGHPLSEPRLHGSMVGQGKWVHGRAEKMENEQYILLSLCHCFQDKDKILNVAYNVLHC